MFGGTADDGRGPVDSALLDRHLRLNPVTPARLGEAFIGIDLFFGYEKKSRGNAKCSHRCLIEIIPHDFSGTIQCDAYGAYRTYAGKHDGIDLAGCWAHARRKFHEALVQGEAKVRAAWILRQIGHLYDIERELRESRAGPRLREAVRRSRSRPILERLHRTFLLLQNRRYYLPKSLMGKALAYALGQWPMLTVFVNDGQIEIDNNLCENAIRPTVVGKIN